jgi:hypothetical protein
VFALSAKNPGEKDKRANNFILKCKVYESLVGGLAAYWLPNRKAAGKAGRNYFACSDQQRKNKKFQEPAAFVKQSVETSTGPLVINVAAWR